MVMVLGFFVNLTLSGQSVGRDGDVAPYRRENAKFFLVIKLSKPVANAGRPTTSESTKFNIVNRDYCLLILMSYIKSIMYVILLVETTTQKHQSVGQLTFI